MSVENLDNPMSKFDSSTTVSRTVTKSNEQIITQQRIVRVSGSNSILEGPMDLSPSDSNIVSMTTDNDGTRRVHTVHKTKQTTYTRRIIRKTGPDGEISTEIIEESDPLDSKLLSLEHTSFPSNEALQPIKSLSHEDIAKTGLFGVSSFTGSASFNCISEAGEKRTINLSTDLIRGEKGSDDDCNRVQSMRLLPTNKCNLAVAPTITTSFSASKSATVIHSLTVNGETKVTSKSAFMCYSGESMVQANSTINDMESFFKEITAQLQIGGFKVLNTFSISPNIDLSDHLALAGGDTSSSILAIEPPPIFDSDISSKDKKQSKIVENTKDRKSLKDISGNGRKEDGEKPQEERTEPLVKIREQRLSKGLLWSNMDEVRCSGILEKLTPEESDLQESIFEIISSEASYHISLDTFIELYYNNQLFDPNRKDAVIDAVEKHQLFSNILLVKVVSLRLLKDLEAHWSQHKPKLLDLADTILTHAQDSDFEQQYVNYLGHQPFQGKSLKTLTQKKVFVTALDTIRMNSKCCKLPLDSFLILPVQRITRLVLLLEKALKCLNQIKRISNNIPDNVIKNHENAIKKIREILSLSESKTFEIGQIVRLSELTKCIEFRNGCKNVNLESKCLLKDGELKAHSRQSNRNALKKLSKKNEPSFYFIVLSDLVMIGKKKSEKILVLDYCDRNLVDVVEQNSGSEVLLTIKFNKSESGSFTNPVQFIVSNKNYRKMWIESITGAVDGQRKN